MDMRDGWIYAAQEDGAPLVKIGYSRDVQGRIAALTTELRARHTLIAAVYVQEIAHQVEQRIHRLLAAQHIERAWFYLHMSQDSLERLAWQARNTVLEEESQRALRRFNARLRMRWGNPFQWFTAQEMRRLQWAIAHGCEGASIVVRIANVLGVSLDYLAGRKETASIVREPATEAAVPA
jgi:hypothetical protein